MTLYKITETHESIIGSRSNYTHKILAYFESENEAKAYKIKNNLTWSGNSSGSVSYDISQVEVEIKD